MQKKFASKVSVKTRKLKLLHPVIKAWDAAVRRYIEQSDDGNVWNYRERPWVGFLAAGAWLAKGVALEEWRTQKQRSGRQASHGRADLYIGIKGKHFDLEAKHGWWRIGGQDLGVARIERLREQAKANTAELTMKGSIRLPAVFASITFPKRMTGNAQKEEKFKAALTHVDRQLKPAAYACVLSSNYDRGIVLFLWRH
jgi:hypothetical protein